MMFCNVSFGGILGDLFKNKTPPACIEGDCNNGHGTYEWENGDIYVGEFKDDKKHGRGTYIFADGKIVKGIFKEDKLIKRKK